MSIDAGQLQLFYIRSREKYCELLTASLKNRFFQQASVVRIINNSALRCKALTSLRSCSPLSVHHGLGVPKELARLVVGKTNNHISTRRVLLLLSIDEIPKLLLADRFLAWSIPCSTNSYVLLTRSFGGPCRLLYQAAWTDFRSSR